jgi:4-hydroxybenzoyl-CoA reductase subunit alpha
LKEPPITVKGITVPPELQGGKFRGAALGRARRSYAAQVVEVAVDEETGEIRVEKVWVAQDCGFAINPLAVEGQIQGAVWMGMGQALGEATRYDPPHGCRSAPTSSTTASRPSPTRRRSRPSSSRPRPNGPFGAKEASEGALAGFLPALQRGGRRHWHPAAELPVTPDAIFRRCASAAARKN